MMGYACPESIRATGAESSPDETDVSSPFQGSFLFRRSLYLNGIWDEKVVSYNLRISLVDNIARCYINRGVALADLVREGNSGLDHALENFETEGGSRFSAYAARCIRQYIERVIPGRTAAGSV